MVRAGWPLPYPFARAADLVLAPPPPRVRPPSGAIGNASPSRFRCSSAPWPTVAATAEAARADGADVAARARSTDPVSPNVAGRGPTVAEPGLVPPAHPAGLAVNAWTVAEVARIRWLAARGVDAVITNVPAVARSALDRSRPPD